MNGFSNNLKKCCVIAPSYLQQNELGEYLDEFYKKVDSVCCKKCNFILKDP